MKFDLDRVVKDRMVIDHLEVQSFEMNIYLVKLWIGDNSGMLYHNASIKRFSGKDDIRRAFKNIMVIGASLVVSTAFDEMIGNPPKAELSVPLPFSMTEMSDN